MPVFVVIVVLVPAVTVGAVIGPVRIIINYATAVKWPCIIYMPRSIHIIGVMLVYES